ARIADRLETASRATAVTLLDLGPRRIRIPATLDLRPRRLSRILSKRKLSCGSSASHEVKTTLDFPSARKECRSPLLHGSFASAPLRHSISGVGYLSNSYAGHQRNQPD